jgi:hypothetical protein
MVRLMLCVLLLTACGAAAESNVTKRVRVEVHLDDGSYIVGTIAQLETLPFRTAYANLELDASQIQTIKTAPDGGDGLVILRNGDRLNGKTQLEKLDLEAAFGKLSVRMHRVISLVFRPRQPLPPELWRGLTLYYSFDEKTRTEVPDRSSAGNHGRLVNGVGWTAKGQVGGAAAFNGKNQFIQVATTEGINFKRRQDFSVLVWFLADPKQADIKNTDNAIVEKWAGADGYPYAIRYRHEKDGTGGHVAMVRWNGKEGADLHAKKRTVGRFHHAAFVKRGHRLEMYMDGEFVAEEKDLRSGRTMNDSPLFIGSRGGRENFFKGVLDEIMVYERAISGDDVKRIYTIQR